MSGVGPTARPLGTLRKPMGTVARGAEQSASTLQADVVIEHRPMMTHGLAGAAPRHVGPGRQVADKGYYAMELRQRLQDLDSEMRALQDEVTKIETDNTLQAQLSRKYENMLAEVRHKEGSLADFNLALDKVRTNIDAGELRDMFDRLREKNEHERAAVDDVFVRAATAERAVRALEDKASEFHDKLAARVGQLGEDARAEYGELRDEEAMLAREAGKKEQLLADIEHRIAAAQADLASDAYQVHARGLQLQRLHAALSKSRAQLEEEVESGATGEALYARLMRLVKETKGDVAELEQRLRDTERAVAKAAEDAERKDKDVVSAKGFLSNSAKYEAVFAKDKHIRDFIAAYPETVALELATKEKTQSNILALLRHIAGQVAAQEALPADAAKLDELRADLVFKQQSAQQAEVTIAAVRRELAARREELARIQGLDKKIEDELKELQQKQADMTAAMAGFKSAEELRREHAERKAVLEREVAAHTRMRDATRLALQQASQEYDAAERRLASNAYYKTLSALEKKLAAVRGASHTIAEAVAARRRESDYSRLLAQTMDLVGELNAMHIAAAASLDKNAI